MSNAKSSHKEEFAPLARRRISSTKADLMRARAVMRGNFHVRFLGGRERATARAYPAKVRRWQGLRHGAIPDRKSLIINGTTLRKCKKWCRNGAEMVPKIVADGNVRHNRLG